MSKFGYSKEQFIGRKLITPNSNNEMEPLLNAPGSLKKREPSKNIQKTN